MAEAGLVKLGRDSLVAVKRSLLFDTLREAAFRLDFRHLREPAALRVRTWVLCVKFTLIPSDQFVGNVKPAFWVDCSSDSRIH